MQSLPEGSVDLVFADPPYNLQLGGELLRPDNSRVDAVDDDWDKFGELRRLRRLHPRLAAGGRRVLKPDGHAVGDRQLPQHLPRRHDAAGPRLLDAERRRLAQVQPDAEFPGQALHQRARDADLGGARPAAKRYTFNYDAMKALNDDLQMRSDWLLPICTGAERLKGEDGAQGASDAEARGAAAPHASWRRPIRATSCSIRSSAPARPARWRKRLGRRFIGIERDASYAAIARKRIAEIAAAAPPRTSRRKRQASAASRASRSASWSRRACCARHGAVAIRAAGMQARVRADGTLSPSALGEHRGSIHQVGAAVQGAPACNGWTFWHFERPKAPACRSTICASRCAQGFRTGFL